MENQYPTTVLRSRRVPMSPSLAGSPSTRQSDRGDEVIAAVIENRAGEVGIALFNTYTLHFSVVQLSDTATFSKTVSFLHTRNPINIIVAHTALEDSSLLPILLQQFEYASITSVHRRYFNEPKGANSLIELASSSLGLSEVTDISKYLSLGASAALLHYVETSLMLTLIPNTIRVKSVVLAEFVEIDRKSAISLGIIPAFQFRGRTLIEVTNHTITPAGSRLFRTNILQPIRDITTLTHRNEAVQYLLENSALLSLLVSSLSKIRGVDIDRVISVFSHEPVASSLAITQSNIDAIVALHHVLKGLTEVKALLAPVLDSAPRLLQTIDCALEAAEMDLLIHEIEEAIDSDIVTATSRHDGRKASGAMLQVQQCFAIRSAFNGLLDITRKKFSDILESVFKSAEVLKERMNIPSLKVAYVAKSGYYLTCSMADSGRLLNADIIACSQTGKLLSFSTPELTSFNAALFDTVEEILSVHKTVLSDILKIFRQRMGKLQALCEATALLDLMVSHTRLATSYGAVCRPSFDSTLSVFEGRSPTAPPGAFHQPNSLSFTGSGVILITGPNGSGKTTFLITIAQLSVLAFIGAFVPAKEFRILLCDRLVALMPASDAIDVTTSSFMKEMRQLAVISQRITRHSIVFFDELGRGTSNVEGNSIAWAAAEWAADVECRCFFSTHSVLLPILSNQYNDKILNYHFSVSLSNTQSCGTSLPHTSLLYSYQLLPGASALEQYGLKVAKQISGPESSFTHRIDYFASKLLDMSTSPSGNPWAE
eukprot:Tbor_TRINITY_DN7475_c0_g1::TRINITY_DN7475_c0_g1_i1::g.14524::m.14524/K08740/MSH4; DNA mismatch repair protein MSH4